MGVVVAATTAAAAAAAAEGCEFIRRRFVSAQALPNGRYRRWFGFESWDSNFGEFTIGTGPARAAHTCCSSRAVHWPPEYPAAVGLVGLQQVRECGRKRCAISRTDDANKEEDDDDDDQVDQQLAA